MIDTKILYKYPFLKEAKSVFELMSSDSKDLIFEKYNSFFADITNLEIRIRKIFQYSLEKKESGLNLSKNQSNMIEYFIVKLILTGINSKFLDNHVSNFLSKIYYLQLFRAKPSEIKKLSQYLELDIKLLEKPIYIDDKMFSFSIHFLSYIPIANLMNNSSWNLVNKNLDKGWIYLSSSNLVRILQEIIRKKIIPEREGSMKVLLDYLCQNPILKKIVNDVNNKLKDHNALNVKFQKTNNNKEIPAFDLFPPCITFILNKALNGMNLNHSERLHIAFFYANTNHSIEETIDIFKNLPDYNESKTKYNVEYSRNANGKGKNYITYGCSKLKSLGLCKAEISEEQICLKGVKRNGETLFKEIKNPMSFLFWKKVELKRNIVKSNGK